MRIGIIGAGQLGQMLGFAARELGFECMFVDPSEEPPAAACGEVIRAEFDDAEALSALAERCDVVSYEFENVSVDALQQIRDRVAIYPPPEALLHAQDRLAEKKLFQSLDIPLPAFHRIDNRADMDAAASTVGLPMVIKTRRFGYDGKGQTVVRTTADLDAAWELLGGTELIAEAWVDFDYEVSAIGARNVSGSVIIFPLTRNRHVDGILHTSRAPERSTQLADLAETYMRRLLDELDYVGVLALELFVAGDRLLANEFAPRVHNSGHWSIEGATPNQFSAHLLAICDQELLTPQLHGHAGMVNLIGSIPDAARSLNAGTLHDYGKAARPGRKLGHITVVSEAEAERDRLLIEIEDSVIESTT
ncbi:MAG: 5-(carboxyamino)imidazole ribonucleotide synthase [Woeseiaceae bacterium]